ncbi:MAG: hypothetical protein GY813_09250 [Halieaceae bacterium]|nr:hypothetical protein [Halieaceae bacterium]
MRHIVDRRAYLTIGDHEAEVDLDLIEKGYAYGMWTHGGGEEFALTAEQITEAYEQLGEEE